MPVASTLMVVLPVDPPGVSTPVLLTEAMFVLPEVYLIVALLSDFVRVFDTPLTSQTYDLLIVAEANVSVTDLRAMLHPFVALPL